MRSRRRPRFLVLTLFVSAVALIACSGSGGSRGAPSPSSTATSGAGGASGIATLQATSAGYVVPARLSVAAAGTLIAVRDAKPQAQSLGAARAWQMLYHSTDLAGHDIPVSGLVLVPPVPQPEPGWPVVAWAHGTTGLADQCAPSIAPDLGHDASAVREVRALLTQGRVVVASDYPGLGTPGVHAYLIGRVDATAVIDSVTAAHHLLGTRISRSWVTVGHSEGGQTALFVAQSAEQHAPQWNFEGTVALAPASTLEALIPLAEATHDPVEQAYLIYALEGLTTVDPSLHVDQLLTPQARPVLADTTRGCIDDITNDLAHRHLDHLLAASPATITRLDRALGHYDDPDQAGAQHPILIAQGTIDQDVPQGATDGLAARLCQRGDRLEYRLFPGLDHNNLVAGSLTLVDDWIGARVHNDTPTTTCAPKP